MERNSKLFTENLSLRQFLHRLQEAMKIIPAVFNSDVQEADFYGFLPKKKKQDHSQLLKVFRLASTIIGVFVHSCKMYIFKGNVVR